MRKLYMPHQTRKFAAGGMCPASAATRVMQKKKNHRVITSPYELTARSPITEIYDVIIASLMTAWLSKGGPITDADYQY